MRGENRGLGDVDDIGIAARGKRNGLYDDAKDARLDSGDDGILNPLTRDDRWIGTAVDANGQIVCFHDAIDQSPAGGVRESRYILGDVGLAGIGFSKRTRLFIVKLQALLELIGNQFLQIGFVPLVKGFHHFAFLSLSKLSLTPAR